MYKLSQKALKMIDECRPNGIIRQLGTALDCSESNINRHIRKNIPNGDLTKVAALKVIRESTGLDDTQILARIKERAKAA